MNLNISDEYFGELLPFIQDETITDITWNGKDLWLDDLKKGRYKSSVKLSDRFVNTFSTRIANLANKNFNMSEPLLEAETDNLRISVIDDSVTNTNRSIAIRKTPALRRLNEYAMLESNYAEALVIKLLECCVKGHCSIIVTGDVGSGKTELVKFLTKYIPTNERTISIEDNFELRLSSIAPELDCVEIKSAADEGFTYQNAIKAALRQLCKWLLMAEARSKEVMQLLEAASTGCIVMTTMHSDDVRKIPDRVVNMMGADGEEKRNDVYNFFDIGVKVGIRKTEHGIIRSIDQICVLDHDNDMNSLYLLYNKGFTGEKLPRNTWQKICSNPDSEIGRLAFLKPDDADNMGNVIKTPEFAENLKELEKEIRNEYVFKAKPEKKIIYHAYTLEEMLDADEFTTEFIIPEELIYVEPEQPSLVEALAQMVDIDDDGYIAKHMKADQEELIRELKREIALVEDCLKKGIEIPRKELKNIYKLLGLTDKYEALCMLDVEDEIRDAMAKGISYGNKEDVETVLGRIKELEND